MFRTVRQLVPMYGLYETGCILRLLLSCQWFLDIFSAHHGSDSLSAEQSGAMRRVFWMIISGLGHSV